MTREEHTAVLRFFLDGVREEVGEELFGLDYHGVEAEQVRASFGRLMVYSAYTVVQHSLLCYHLEGMKADKKYVINF